MTVTKLCSGCKRAKAAAFFTQDQHQPDGLATQCRECRSVAINFPETVCRTPRCGAMTKLAAGLCVPHWWSARGAYVA